MKANKKQIELAEMIANHIKHIPLGNDIDSPTHSGDNEAEGYRLASEIVKNIFRETDLAEDIIKCFDKALEIIRRVKDIT